jgi:hypothetical protein
MKISNKQPLSPFDDPNLMKGDLNGGCFKVRVLKKWTVYDVVIPGKIVSIDMMLMDNNVWFCVDYCIFILKL